MQVEGEAKRDKLGQKRTERGKGAKARRGREGGDRNRKLSIPGRKT